MKYSQFPYQRINLEEFKKDTQVMINNFNGNTAPYTYLWNDPLAT